jgi:hypothetical protein
MGQNMGSKTPGRKRIIQGKSLTQLSECVSDLLMLLLLLRIGVRRSEGKSWQEIDMYVVRMHKR